MNNPTARQAVRQFKVSWFCHSEFISESYVFSTLQLQEILKRPPEADQDDNCQTASKTTGNNEFNCIVFLYQAREKTKGERKKK